MDTMTYLAWVFIPLGILFVLELFSEEFVARVLRSPGVRARGLWYFSTNVFIAIGLRELNGVTTEALPDLLGWHAPAAVAACSCILIGELANYWFHRLGHAWLWSLHFVHHREEVYSMTLGVQAHALEIVLRGTLLSAVLSLLGFSMTSVQVYMIFFIVGAAFQHSNNDYTLGWLDSFVVTPSTHRYHHAKGKHINFGATIVLWDMVFGTYLRPDRAEARRLSIGIDDAGSKPYGFWAELVHPFRTLRALLEKTRAVGPHV